jgi:FkbM family methyltransferase
LRVHFLGGKTIASLHDLHGGRVPVKVSQDNVERIISLGKLLAKFQDRYEVSNIIKTIRPDFTTEEPNLLSALCFLGGGSKYVTGIIRFNDNHYLIIDIDGVKWIVRKAPPISLMDDTLFGPLLSYYQEPRECEWFSNALHERGTFVDVGANVGGYSVRACKKGARLIAVEPDPDNYRVLKLNLELNQCIDAHVLNIAAGSREEIRQLYEGDDGAPVGYTLKRGDGIRKAKCSVTVKPLDAAIPPLLSDEKVDLLKVDVEGSEVEVIKGAINLLKRTRYVIVEVIPSTESKTLELLDLLRPLGFKLIDKVCREFGCPRAFRESYCNLFLRNSI